MGFWDQIKGNIGSKVADTIVDPTLKELGKSLLGQKLRDVERPHDFNNISNIILNSDIVNSFIHVLTAHSQVIKANYQSYTYSNDQAVLAFISKCLPFLKRYKKDLGSLKIMSRSLRNANTRLTAVKKDLLGCANSLYGLCDRTLRIKKIGSIANKNARKQAGEPEYMMVDLVDNLKTVAYNTVTRLKGDDVIDTENGFVDFEKLGIIAEKTNNFTDVTTYRQGNLAARLQMNKFKKIKKEFEKAIALIKKLNAESQKLKRLKDDTISQHQHYCELLEEIGEGVNNGKKYGSVSKQVEELDKNYITLMNDAYKDVSEDIVNIMKQIYTILDNCNKCKNILFPETSSSAALQPGNDHGAVIKNYQSAVKRIFSLPEKSANLTKEQVFELNTYFQAVNAAVSIISSTSAAISIPITKIITLYKKAQLKVREIEKGLKELKKMPV